MGINGLLKQLESISQKKHLSEYKGMKVAVDGYCWLHKSIFLIKSEVFENPNSTKYMTYLIRRLESLLANQIIPVIVFDGDKLPMKKEEESDRERKREETMRFAKDLYDKGLVENARQKMLEAWDINPQMAFNFIKELKKRNIEFFVAPYEADAQLAYLAQIKYVDLVISEDSDMLALGCPKVLFKLDLDSGYGVEISLSDLPRCKDLDFTLFNHDKFLQYCILSGCDYFKLKGIGWKTAYQCVKERNNYKDILQLVKNCNRASSNNPYELEESFEKAFLTFKFQVIFCPKEQRMKHFNNVEDTIYTFINKYDDISFLGKIYEQTITKDIVFGIIDPITHKKFEESKNDIVSRMFNLPNREQMNKEKGVVNINRIEGNNFKQYDRNNNNLKSNNITSSYNNISTNNIVTNGITANYINEVMVSAGITEMIVKPPSKRGRPKKNRDYNNFNFNTYNNILPVEINKISEKSIPDVKFDEKDLEEISAYIYDENKDLNLEEDSLDLSEKSDQKQGPDSIQLISINLTQSQPNELKRKNPYSSQTQSSLQSKEHNSFHNKKFKYMKDNNFTKKSILKGANYTDPNLSDNNSSNSYIENKKDNFADINKIKSYKNINMIDLTEEKSVKSNDTDNVLNYYTDIFATYEKTSDEIKIAKLDINKRKENQDDGNKINVTYEHLKNKNKYTETELESSKREAILTKTSINESFLINFDDYTLDNNEQFYGNEFLKKKSKISNDI